MTLVQDAVEQHSAEFADKHHCLQVFWIQMAEDFFKHLYGQHFVDQMKAFV